MDEYIILSFNLLPNCPIIANFSSAALVIAAICKAKKEHVYTHYSHLCECEN